VPVVPVVSRKQPGLFQCALYSRPTLPTAADETMSEAAEATRDVQQAWGAAGVTRGAEGRRGGVHNSFDDFDVSEHV
jgi:hypothetical protein